MLLSFALRAGAADPSEARELWEAGKYAECIKFTSKAIESGERDEDWPLLLSQCLRTTGAYTNAAEVISTALRRYYSSMRLRIEGHEVYKLVGDKDKAREMLDDINSMAGRRYGITKPADLVALGQGALLLGVDARVVLENFFDAAKKLDPKYGPTYAAIGNLALDKHDEALAAKTFEEGLKAAPENPELMFGLARAYAQSDSQRTSELLDDLLKKNPRHLPALLLLADHSIDAEAYDQAKELLDKVFAVNPVNPEALAYKAVLHHIRNEPEAEAEARALALKKTPANPKVDYLLGQKLSQKYRFNEGSRYQRAALNVDKGYLPSQIQLAQDLLRLGDETEGWDLAEKVYAADAYDVQAYNLVTLKETIGAFATVTNEHFLVRMSPKEKMIYGERVLRLLERAHSRLTQKYGLALTNQVLVEIFPDQKDFAVRTFGMPGGSGYLGVCFGNVITANSPAAQVGTPSNWEAMLWHEFCHVITLHITRNRMPRWLSEGISVYEEIQSDPVWGQHMDPAYREMILKGELKPIGKLSGAFLNPKDGHHLQFAYYESSLVVRYIVEKHGFEKLSGLLRDLGQGMQINPALEKNVGALDKIEGDFEKFATDLAKALGPSLEWEKPKPDPTWRTVHPNNYYVLLEKASKLVAQTNAAEAKPILQKLIDLYPGQNGEGNAYEILAKLHRSAGEAEDEKKTLKAWIAHDADAVDALDRLMTLERAERDWPLVSQHAAKFLAVNPLVVKPHEFLADALAAQQKSNEALEEYRVVLAMDPPDPAQTHFALAKLLHAKGDPEARKQVLDALDAAPRFRDAHKLLLELRKPQP